jgi:hypothetical protein
MRTKKWIVVHNRRGHYTVLLRFQLRRSSQFKLHLSLTHFGIRRPAGYFSGGHIRSRLREVEIRIIAAAF